MFTLCRLATGLTQAQIFDWYMSRDKNWWTHKYPWMLKYLGMRYARIVGHQGLTRFLDDFPCFKRTIEEFIQCNHICKLVDGRVTIIPGINFLPWDAFGFIKDSIDRILTPFSGPCGDYKGIARKAEYADPPQEFYS